MKDSNYSFRRFLEWLLRLYLLSQMCIFVSDCGVGASVVASIHLSQGKNKAVSINITQALLFSALIILLISALCFYFVEPLGKLLGSSERLLPDVIEYMVWYVPFLVFYVFMLSHQTE